MARVILSMCFMSMLAFTAQAVPSRAQLSKKTTNAERIIREEYQLEVLGSREMAESRNAEIRAGVLDQNHRNLKPRNMRMLVDTAPREYLESREADHREAIINRHHRVSRTADLSGRRRNFDIDAFSFSSHTSSASPSFPTESYELSTSASTMTLLDAPNPSQAPALLEFRAALDTFGYLISWNISNSCKYWRGLTCDSNGFVTKLDLSSNQLTGSIPDSIGNLTSLTYVDLSSNPLTGSIPDSIGNLTSLTHL